MALVPSRFCFVSELRSGACGAFGAFRAPCVQTGGLTGSAVVRYAWIVIMRKSRDYIYDIREIGRRIRLLRELKQVSQKELGDAVGLSRERFSKVEKGQSGLSVEVMMRVADYFGVPLEFLYFGEMREARLRGQLLAIARMLCLLAGEETEQEGKEAG